LKKKTPFYFPPQIDINKGRGRNAQRCPTHEEPKLGKGRRCWWAFGLFPSVSNHKRRRNYNPPNFHGNKSQSYYKPLLEVRMNSSFTCCRYVDASLGLNLAFLISTAFGPLQKSLSYLSLSEKSYEPTTCI